MKSEVYTSDNAKIVRQSLRNWWFSGARKIGSIRGLVLVVRVSVVPTVPTVTVLLLGSCSIDCPLLNGVVIASVLTSAGTMTVDI